MQNIEKWRICTRTNIDNKGFLLKSVILHSQNSEGCFLGLCYCSDILCIFHFIHTKKEKENVLETSPYTSEHHKNRFFFNESKDAFSHRLHSDDV